MKKLRIFLLTTFSILFAISCEIGLGESVDTEAPSLEITNPPADAIIRDEFAISGSCCKCWYIVVNMLEKRRYI